MDNLEVDADETFNISHAISNDAEELREELASLQQEWDTLSRGWTGAAASAYSSIWDEWREGATTLVDSLAESSRNLGHAAARYAKQDTASATTLDSTMDLGL
ncbi:WXG100 family type VII secretion target [Mycolicibacterium baixiangningiae]|uniref:WXG100 family type VII secretion target n=1 Tax=Mycolicibacterium baixiangningiae TaxID=2761578 RepID=UPI001867F2C6|nr:WXG100 family type VII secretion target [Mycolicibacterium baixiangningiae]